MFRKLLDPDPTKRLELGETVRFMEDKWLRKGATKETPGKDGQSQLTLGSFQVKMQYSNIFQQGVNVTLITECPFESVREKQPPLHTSPTRRGDDSGQIE